MGFHPFEIFIVLFVIMLVFGAKKLPQLSRGIGESIQQFKKGVNEIEAPKEEKEG